MRIATILPVTEWPEDSSIAFEYDGAGRLSGIVDGAGRTLHSEVDADGDLVRLVDDDGVAMGFEYQGHRMGARRVEGEGALTYHWDPQGAIDRVTYPSGRERQLQSLLQAAGPDGISASTDRLAVLTDGEGAEWPLSRKFGCQTDMAMDLLILARDLGLVPYGISFHVGSQQRKVKAWDRALAMASQVFRDCAERGIGGRIPPACATAAAAIGQAQG